MDISQGLAWMRRSEHGAVNLRKAFTNAGDQAIYRTGVINGWELKLIDDVRLRLQPSGYIDLNAAGEATEFTHSVCCRAGMKRQNRPLVNFEQPYRPKRFPSPQDYAHAYCSLLKVCADEVLQGLTELMFCRRPMIFGCWLGKDRTGIVSALGELYLGHTKEKVLENYLRSNEYLARSSETLEPLARKREMDVERYRRRIAAHPESLLGFLSSCPAEISAIFRRLDGFARSPWRTG